jgi:hypothetical protein
MGRTLTREECLALPVERYNHLMRTQHPDKEFRTCEHCGRLHTMCCICDEAQRRWQDMVDEVRAVGEQQREEYDRRHGPIMQNKAVTDALQNLMDTLEREYGEMEWGAAVSIFAGEHKATLNKNHP